MDFDFSDDQEQLRDAVRKWVDKGYSFERRRAIQKAGGFSRAVYGEIAELGYSLEAQDVLERMGPITCDTVRADRKYARAIGFRYHDGKPGIVEGLLSRGDRRVGKIIEGVWRDGGRFDGWSEHFSYDRWMAAAEAGLSGTGVDVDWFTTRQREYDEVLPWDHLDSGLDKDWLWQDWEDAVAAAQDPEAVEDVEDCRWTPCYDCGVCPDMGTETQIGPG